MRDPRARAAIEQSREAIEQSCRLRRRSAMLLEQSARLLQRARALRQRHDFYSDLPRRPAADADAIARAEPPPETIAQGADPAAAPHSTPDPAYEDMLIYDCPQIFCALERLMRLHGVSTQCSISVSAVNQTPIPSVQRVEFLIEVPEEELGNRREYEIWVDDYELIFRVLPSLAE